MMLLHQRTRRRACILFLAAASGLLTAARTAPAQDGIWTTRGPFGGSVYCLVSDPSHAATLYAGPDRGVYKSDDAGASWSAVNAGLPAFRIQTIAIDPAFPSTLYAGTLTPDGVASVGIFKSIDGGQTWQSKTLGGFNVALETSAFQFDPSNSSRVLAATTLGLVRSTDGGESWSTYGNVNDSFYTLVTDPSSATTLYAGNINGSGIFKSTDSGAHWTTINKGLPTDQGATGVLPLILGFAVDPAHPATLYAGTYGNGLYRSTDSGSNWSSVNTGMRTAYVTALAFEPLTLLAATLGGGAYQSADGGGTWAPSNAGLDVGIANSLLADPAAPVTVYAALFDGVYRSADGGGT